MLCDDTCLRKYATFVKIFCRMLNSNMAAAQNIDNDK